VHVKPCRPFVAERDLLFALEPRRLFLALAGQAFIFFLIKKRSKKIKAWRLLLLPVAIHPARIQAAPRMCHPFASWIRLPAYAPAVALISGWDGVAAGSCHTPPRPVPAPRIVPYGCG